MTSQQALISLNSVHLVLANQVILQAENWQIHPKKRIALVGRNGAGKSTVLRLLQGMMVADGGQLQKQQGLRVVGLAQDVPLDEHATVFNVLVSGLDKVGKVLATLRQQQESGAFEEMAESHQALDDLQAWDALPRVDMIASQLGLPLDAVMSGLSGGMKRRVLLGAAILEQPDVLLLDEPTNHLDLPAIEWLESYLLTYPGTLILVTHDRTFLSKVATTIVELDRGHLQMYECDYETFLDRREALRFAAQKQEAIFDKRLADEEVWIRTGVKARRTRNEGRVRALKAMRDTYSQRRVQQAQVAAWQWDVARSGTVVLEAQHLEYHLGENRITQDFSIVLMRGDKVGIIGPNGCGKTTLIRLLLGDLTPDSGRLRLGTGLVVAYFDQLRRQLDPQKTVMSNVAEGADHVTIQGKSKHVSAYLQDFLFKPEQLNQPVSSLSGGECNRLLLAKLFAKPANVLVLDEPTNDLDIETLELLETLLIDFPGTLLLISHDRSFINQVVSSVWVYEEDKCFHDYVGGYEDYLRHKATQRVTPSTTKAVETTQRSTTPSAKLSYNEQRELKTLPQKIADVEHHISALQQTMLSTHFYQQPLEEMNGFKQKLTDQEAVLAELYARWEVLESKEH